MSQTYPFNPAGATGANNINNEVQLLAPANAAQYNWLIPIFAPFFLDSLVVSIVPTSQSPMGNLVLNSPVTLTVGVDFFPALQFVDATANCGQAVYGALAFTDPLLAGEVTLSYLTLGGSWPIARATQLAKVLAQDIDPRTTYWEDAFGVTSIFPPVTLTYNEVQQVGIAAILAELTALATVLSTGSPLSSPISFSDHITNYNNPHTDTAATFGLDNVPNWQTATLVQAAAGAAFNLFVTPAGAAAALGSPTVLPAASATVFGITKLNLGAINDDTDTTKALTTTGLLNLKNAAGDNAIKALFSYERQIVHFTPFPIPYPVSCLGQTCNNFADLVSAVQNNLAMSPVQGSALRGCVWLPHDMPTPTLTCTAL